MLRGTAMTDAWQEGHDAYDRYGFLSDNPYPGLSDKRAQWYAGWFQAQCDDAARQAEREMLDGKQ